MSRWLQQAHLQDVADGQSSKSGWPSPARLTCEDCDEVYIKMLHVASVSQQALQHVPPHVCLTSEVNCSACWMPATAIASRSAPSCLPIMPSFARLQATSVSCFVSKPCTLGSSCCASRLSSCPGWWPSLHRRTLPLLWQRRKSQIMQQAAPAAPGDRQHAAPMSTAYMSNVLQGLTTGEQQQQPRATCHTTTAASQAVSGAAQTGCPPLSCTVLPGTPLVAAVPPRRRGTPRSPAP